MDENGSDIRRDFFGRAGLTLVCAGIFFLMLWKSELMVRYWFVFFPAVALAYVGGLIITARNSRKRAKKDGKRRANGKQFKFMDVENQSMWITFFAIASAFVAGAVLLYLWHGHLLARYWFIAVPAAVVMVVGMIFTPTPAGDYGTS
jgi:hypothetical protein